MPEKHTMGVSGVSGSQYRPLSSNWYVLGAGAMGCLWAAALQTTQNSLAAPVLLLRDRASLLSYPGSISIERTSGEVTQLNMPALACNSLSADMPPIQNLLLTCKAQDTEAALAQIAPYLTDTSRIVLLQNGIRVQQNLTERRPPGTVFCLSTSHGAWIKSPFHVVHAGQGNTWLGMLSHVDAGVPQDALKQLLKELPVSAMHIQIDQDMSARLWLKFAVNCAINAMTVFYNCQNGALLSNPIAKQHLEKLCIEISTLLSALPECPALPDLWQHVQQVATATQYNYSSTLQDIQRGKPTEIAHLNGWLCELAACHQLPCPLNIALLNHVIQQQSSAF
jgi:2-dehydropantoate 2-reductase